MWNINLWKSSLSLIYALLTHPDSSMQPFYWTCSRECQQRLVADVNANEKANDNDPCKLLVTSHSFESSVTLHILKVNVLCSLDFYYNAYSAPASIFITIPLLPLFSSHFLYQYPWFSLSLLRSSLFQLYTLSLVIINPPRAFKYVPIIHKGLHVIQTLAWMSDWTI